LARPSIFVLFTGFGKPEPLRYGLSGYWSRVITGEHRRADRVAGKPAVLTISSAAAATTTEGMMTENPRDLSTPEDSDGPLRSFEELGAALGRDCANVTRLEESPSLDTEAATRAKVEKSPYSVQKVGREALKLWIEPLADYLAKSTPPRGLEQVLCGLDHQQLALKALRSVLDQIHFGWDKRKDRKDGKRTAKNPDMLFRVELGHAVRDELEFAGLLGAKKYVKAARNKHAALGRMKFRRVDWTRAECAQVGDWLWDALAKMSCFDTDEHGFPLFPGRP
jgi:YoeB-like toxin of bacterial type II toxin-antitoxin system